MPRLAGVDIPEKKKLRYSLRYIYGIGPKFADDICEASNIDPENACQRTLRTGDRSSIAAIIDENYIVEGALASSAAAEHSAVAGHSFLPW